MERKKKYRQVTAMMVEATAITAGTIVARLFGPSGDGGSSAGLGVGVAVVGETTKDVDGIKSADVTVRISALDADDPSE